jgi:hypothetical protein
MNPNVDSSPGVHLPEPLPTMQGGGSEQAPQMMESRPEMASVEHSTSNNQSMAMPSLGSVPATQPPQANSGSATQPSGPAAADDGDTIEKEWIVKAKQIVNATRSDPYQQNRQLAAFKADYLRKRYNKIVKLSE